MWKYRVRRLLWLSAALVAAAALWRLYAFVRGQIGAPFDLVYETPNLRTIQLIQQGRNPYDPAVYAGPPFWITLYTPLYHHIVARLPAAAENPFLTGRMVAMVCMLSAAATPLLVCARERWAGILALGAFFLLHPVVSNTAFLKNDPMGLLFAARRDCRAARTFAGSPYRRRLR